MKDMHSKYNLAAPKQEPVNVGLPPELHAKIKKYAEDRGMRMKDLAPELVEIGLDKMIFAEKTFPKIEYISQALNEIVLKDHRLNRHIDVRKDDDELNCEIHEKEPCEHIEFVKVRCKLAELYGFDR